MTRPLRIEYEGAWYHVMNRGIERRAIFLDDDQRRMFLDLLGELDGRFGVQTHAYCLMDNHYHLLLHTPHANLSRAMRHLDGVYTQRFNRVVGRDGPLFRGRFKAIIVDADAYLLQVSRYIHRNPVEANVVDQLQDFPWSSYPAYINRVKPKKWLQRQFTYEMLGGKGVRYRKYVERGNDDETATFYGGKKQPAIFGDKDFREWALQQYDRPDQEIPEVRTLTPVPDVNQIIDAVCKTCHVDRELLLQGKRGQRNLPRQIAIYLCCQLGQLTQIDVARQFGLNHYGAVAASNYRLNQWASADLDIAGMISNAEKLVKETT